MPDAVTAFLGGLRAATISLSVATWRAGRMGSHLSQHDAIVRGVRSSAAPAISFIASSTLGRRPSVRPAVPLLLAAAAVFRASMSSIISSRRASSRYLYVCFNQAMMPASIGCSFDDVLGGRQM